MGRLLRAARPPLLPPLLLPLLLLLLAGGASLGMCAAGSDEPSPEGLTSTSLLDLLLPTGLEPLDSEEPSEAMGLGAGLGAPGSGFPSEESEESRILQPPQYFWEEEEELNDSSLDLGPTADYVFPDLTEKAGPVEDTSQAQEAPRSPYPLPKMNLAELPWHMGPGEEDEEEEEEGLLPVTRSQEAAQSPAHGSPPPSGSHPSGAPALRHQESGAQAASAMEVGVSVEPGLSLPAVTPRPATLGGQDEASQGAGDTTLPAARHGVDLEAPQEASEEAALGAASLAGQPGEAPSPASFPQPGVPGGAEAPDEGALQPGASAAVPLGPRDMELTPSSAPWEREDLGPPPQEGQAAGAAAPSGTPWDSTQVICKDWSNLAGRNYVVLNMTENVDCEVFRQHRGLQLLALVEEVLPRHGSGRHGDWHISLSKPSEKEQHLLMTLVGEQGVVPTQDVLSMLGDIRRSLVEIGIQNYSTTSSCQARATQVRSDYGTLFVVLVVIGAVCVVIIVLGLLYNCWQRRLPKLKHVSHGEELRFVENGCHDNPTLDVASDSQSEMQEKQPSLNGGGAVNGPGGWSALMGGKRDPEDSDVFEEDTHL
ncbi:podocalyxin-like protein 2 isoform X2 [Camelus ferus]|uniref:Podocalyxin-like protein 2 isoform X2 n=1 Tax=Camelus ferus TaxID=419612 RepID=A0A8B8R9L5_CAMFR|nr:podocalyxin-like protein 2 isoform X2 [Camelus ferus]